VTRLGPRLVPSGGREAVTRLVALAAAVGLGAAAGLGADLLRHRRPGRRGAVAHQAGGPAGVIRLTRRGPGGQDYR
jgi:hypothetical protein